MVGGFIWILHVQTMKQGMFESVWHNDEHSWLDFATTELFHKGSKGKLAKYNGGKTSAIYAMFPMVQSPNSEYVVPFNAWTQLGTLCDTVLFSPFLCLSSTTSSFTSTSLDWPFFKALRKSSICDSNNGSIHAVLCFATNALIAIFMMTCFELVHMAQAVGLITTESKRTLFIYVGSSQRTLFI